MKKGSFMPSTSTSTMGRAIIDPTGKKPVRIGRNIDGFDALDVAQQLKEAKLVGVKTYNDTISRNKTVIVPAINALQAQVQSLHDDAVALSNYLGVLSSTSNAFKDLQSTVVRSGDITSAYVDVTIDSTIAKATTSAVAIQIQRLASVDSRVTNNTTLTTGIIDNASTPVTSASAALSITGSIYINGIEITVAPTDTLNSIASDERQLEIPFDDN